MSNAPRRGNQGDSLRVKTNSFELRRNGQQIYYHYAVISPEIDKSRRAHEIISKMQLSHAQMFNPRAAYDGRANLFSIRDDLKGQYTVQMGRSTERGIFTIKISPVAIIQPNDIQRLTAPGGATANTNTMAVNLLQIIVRQSANHRHGYPSDSKSFFTDKGAQQLARGLEAWRGYFQSVRPVLNRILINVDITAAIIVAMDYIQIANKRELSQLHRTNPAAWSRLRSFLKGLMITAQTARTGKARPIKDIIPAAGLYQFDKDGITTTVEEHFRTAHNRQLAYPQLFGVRIGKDAVFPAEVCNVVPGQIYKKKVPAEVTSAFLKFTTQKPGIRLKEIMGSVGGPGQVFDYTTSDFMQEAGVTVSPHPIEITGRVLMTPGIRYGTDTVHIQPRAGKWNVVGKRLLKAESIPWWGVLHMDSTVPPNAVEPFINKLRANLKNLGLPITRDPALHLGNPTNVEAALSQILQKILENTPEASRPPKPPLLIVILPGSAAETRRKVKHWGDTQQGIPTQCIRGPKLRNANDQYCNNVALKINAKIGGINSTIDREIMPQGTMVVGMDVGHPGPGMTTRPSVTSLVASLDQAATRYTSYASVQEPRLEIIQDLNNMLTRALRDFARQWRGLYPRFIVFYRDGVSEGEYAKVAQQEVAEINRLLLKIPRIKEDGSYESTPAFDAQSKPKIIFIVVGKRHHIRFFPLNQQEADSSGNCPPGFVVDDQITNATYPDFYLQSHSGIIGTSRPSHYIVLENETAWTPDAYQQLSFNLCHVYASATRSVSIPAPVYYADRVCSRAEFHFTENLHYADEQSSVASDKKTQFDLEPWKAGFIEAKLRRQMYFL